MLAEFIANNWSSVLLSLTTAGALAFCRWTWKQMKAYQALLEERDQVALQETIDEEIERQITPIVNDIEELRSYIRNVDLTNEEQKQKDIKDIELQ